MPAVTALGLSAVEFVREADDDGELGEVCWLHLPGHPPLEDAAAVFWAAMLSEEGECRGFGPAGPHPVLIGRGGPYHAWLKTVPARHEDDGGWDGAFRYVVRRAVQSSRGWQPITAAEVGLNAQPPPRCGRWPACHEPATYGVLGPRAGQPDKEWVWLCPQHHAELGDGFNLLAAAG